MLFLYIRENVKRTSPYQISQKTKPHLNYVCLLFKKKNERITSDISILKSVSINNFHPWNEAEITVSSIPPPLQIKLTAKTSIIQYQSRASFVQR